MYRITQLAVARPSVTLLLAAGLFFSGLAAWGQLKSELLPDIDFPIVTVVAGYPGAGAQDVSGAVTEPIERAVAGVPRLRDLQSTSAANISIVVAQFEFGTNVKETRTTIESNLVSAGLPQGVEPTVTSLNINNFPVVSLTISGADGADETEVSRLVAGEVVPELRTIAGVASVDVLGGERQRLEVVLDPDQLSRAGVSVAQVQGVLAANNLTLPAGTVSEGDTILPISTTHRFDSLDEVRDLVVGFMMPQPAAGPTAAPTAGPTPAPAPPAPVTIGDLGTVELVARPLGGYSRTDGQPSIVIFISKSADANTVEVSDAVAERLAAVRDRVGGRIRWTYTFDSSNFIRESISGLQREGGLGALFAVVVIFLFLLNVRSTLVAAMSIPLSVMTALALMLVGGVSLNIMTLGGLAVAVGRVVDDAIVVLENIYRHRMSGEPIRQSVLDGTREVSAAITSSTLTTVGVFLPLGFVGGLVSQFFLPFAITVTFALLASLAVALTVVPTLAYFFIPRVAVLIRAETPVHSAAGAAAIHGAPIRSTWLQRLYTPLLKTALRFRWATLLIAAVLFAATNLLIPQIPQSFINAGSEKVLNVLIAPPPGTAPEVAMEQAREAEAILAAHAEVVSYQTTVASGGDTGFAGLQASFTGRSASSAQIFVRLQSEVDLRDETTVLLEALAPVQHDGYTVSVAQVAGVGNRLQVIVSGPDLATVRDATARIAAAVRGVPDVVNVASDLAAEAPELQVTVDPNKAIGAGLTTAQVAGELRTILVGQTIGRIRLGDGDPTDLYLAVDRGKLMDPGADPIEQLKSLPVGSAIKRPLGEIATVEQVAVQASVTRVDQAPAATVSADILTDDVQAVSTGVRAAIDSLRLPEGVNARLAGVSEFQSEGFGGLIFSMAVAVLVVYLIMVLVFDSLIDPFVILFSLPLATIGAFTALYLSGKPLGISALVGMLMLIGIVVTNAIVFLDLVEQLRHKGMGTYDALVQAGRTRVRPILMTAVATILALIPLALGFNEGSIIAAELGTVVIGGLFTSTLLTLVVVPVVYSLIDGGKQRARRLAGRPEGVGS